MSFGVLPFVRHEFEYPHSTDAATRLLETLQRPEWQDLTHSVLLQDVTIYKNLGLFFRNSWNPIFRGRIVHKGARSTLVGYFRMNWFAFAFSVFFVLFAAFQVLQTYSSPEQMPGYVADWKHERLEFDLQFLGMAVAVIAIGWAVGIPSQRRILAAIRDSTRA
jgi:hypothetical protein